MDAQQPRGLCLNPALETPGAMGMIQTALKGVEVMQEPFIRSKQQSGGWGVLDPAPPCPSFTLTQSHHSQGSPPKSSCAAVCVSPVTFISEQQAHAAFHDDPMGSSHSQAVIRTQLMLKKTQTRPSLPELPSDGA